MPDETIALKGKALESTDNASSDYVFMNRPLYNIDDMDNSAFMSDHRMEGVFTVMSKCAVSPDFPGQIYVDGVYSGDGITAPGFMPGTTTIGLPVRRLMREYGKTYTIRYENAKKADGSPMEPLEFQLTTLRKVLPGHVYPEHDALVLDCAREGAVLLKNDNHALPLGTGAVVNAFGKGAPCYRLGCVGAGKINPRYGIRFEEGIKNYSGLTLNEALFEYYRMREDNSLPEESLIRSARELNDTAIVVLTRGTGESQDNTLRKGDYYLTDDERTLLDKITNTFGKTVVVLNTGYPIEMNWLKEYSVDAVLWCGLNGMAGGRAVAEILEGTVSPSGRLADTWAWDYNDYPSAANFYIMPQDMVSSPFDSTAYVNTVYEEGLYVGYRYFSTFGVDCAFPFGHGLSYTDFKVSCVRTQLTGMNGFLDIRVTNCGKMPGKHSVLLFAQLPDGCLEQPARRLIAFGKTGMLAPGAGETVRLCVEAEQLKSYDTKRAAWIVEPGTIRFYLGGSVTKAVETASLEIPEEIIISQVSNVLTPPLAIRELSKYEPETSRPTGKDSGFVRCDTLPWPRNRTHIPETRTVTADKPGRLITLPMVSDDPSLLDSFVAQLSDYELCRLSIGARTGWNPEDNGFAGTLYTEGPLAKYEIPEYYMADGNNGLNLNIATIGFPVSSVICSTFNEELTYREGRAIATEAIDQNLHCILAPAMNIHRNPLCGRHSEYFSEDPYLSGRMGGMESKGIESMGLASVMKHFIANNAENFRNRNHSLMTERTARELYLKVFETAMSVHMPDAVMTGYNPTNGCWCAGDEELLETVLRGEWNFSGYVMTDWGSSTCCPAAPTAQSGNSWVAPGEMDDSEVTPMLEAMADGTLDKERLRRNVYDMYGVIAKYGIRK